MSIQAQVLSTIRSEPIGAHTVADLNLPDTFLRRVADRVIRESFENRARLVVAERPGAASVPAAGQTASDLSLTVVEREDPAGYRAYRAGLREGRPELRGYRAPLGAADWAASPMDLHPEELSPEAREAAAIIARGLAREGLLATLARAVEVLGPARFEQVGRAELSALARLGLPVDLLDGFAAAEGRGGEQVVREVAAGLRRAGGVDKLKRTLSRAAFVPRASCPGFRGAPDSGQVPLGAVRVQATSGQYWSGPGDGGCVDLLRQLAGAAPGAAITVSVERKHLGAFAAQAARWPGARERVTLIPEELPVAQWAQDNGKSGWDGGGEPALLVPRYASRGEAGAVFVPGETFLAGGLAAAGARVVQSSLLFQGGNVLLVEEPLGRRTLLLGEAEVWRNTALGLSREQAVEAFGVEFGVDRCVVLPAASFHIDFEVTLRTTGPGVRACVPDAASAARLILECGIGALERHGTLSAADGGAARAHLGRGRVRECLAIVGPVVGGAAIGPGRWSEAFSGQFSAGPSDHGPSNLYRVLLALDLLSALSALPAEMPAEAPARAYLESFRRQEADRHILRRHLRDAGFEPIPVPSLAEPFRGLTALNGLHEPGRYLMPAYGGLFAAVDDAAAASLGAAFGESTKIERLFCAETQRRSGALRCAVSVATTGGAFGLR